MNLHAIAGPIVAAVNPWITGNYLVSTGYGLGEGAKRTPLFADAVPVMIQMQPLVAKELEQLSGLNIQGTKRGMYIDGDRRGVSRPDVKGGDLVTTAGGTWLVVLELENWSATAGWTKVAVVLQSPSC